MVDRFDFPCERSTVRRIATTTMALACLLLSGLTLAGAATTTRFAQWGPIAGSTNDFSTTMQLPATGFPAATVTSDSRADVALPTGATNWFGENTPPGQQYGSSRDQAYLNLRPRADNASSPSTTTYTFERATPAGWTFVLGDIDADQVQVSATRADGAPASAAELGFRGAFNLCDTTPRPSSVCADNGRPKDVPAWDAASATLRGNAAAVDSDGASGWFEPTTSLRTLTFSFTRRGGFPVFQTWFAVKRQDVSGTVAVSGGSCDLSGATVSLLDAGGAVVAIRPVGAAGGYSFTGVAASDGYRVALADLPDACIVTGPSSRGIDLRTADAVADFAVRQVVPVPVSGRVTSGTTPLEGVAVTLTPQGGGASETTTTDVDGRYVFDDNPDDTTYTISVTPPTGYLPVADRTATIPDGATTPVTGQDFALPARPSVSGTVTGAGGPVAGVTVELTGPGGVLRAVTAADGTYVISRVPVPGPYSLTVPTPPAGYDPAPVVPVVVTTADVTGQDVALTRAPATGSIAGTVTLDGAPLPGVDVTVRPSSGTPVVARTDAEGTYGVGGLVPGSYEISVVAPAGAGGATPRSVTITAAGDVLVGQDFAFTTVPAVTGPGVPPDDGAPGDDTTDPDESGTAPNDDADTAPGPAAALPDAGGPPAVVPLAGLALLLAGTAAVVGSRVRRS